MNRTPIDPHSTRGILAPPAPAGEPLPWRVAPSPGLAYFVDYLWGTQWDLAEPHIRETLPFPSVHLSIHTGTPGRSGVHGVVRGKFSIRLEGRGSVVAVKFRPGGFHPFLGAPVSTLTDRVRSLDEVFGPGGARLEAEVRACPEVPQRAAVLEQFLLERLPAADPMVEVVDGVVQLIAGDRSITRVETVAERTGLAARTLQRLFVRYVGASPKWVVQRYRLQEAAERLARDGTGALSRLAYELGYADQAHFIRDFRDMVGATPAEYARRAASARHTAQSARVDGR
jgi:AraC-like DNA-binding protein